MLYFFSWDWEAMNCKNSSCVVHLATIEDPCSLAVCRPGPGHASAVSRPPRMARPSSLVWQLTPVSLRVAPCRCRGCCHRRGANVLADLCCIAGCGKSTFMRRMTGIFGGSPKPPAGVQLQATPAAWQQAGYQAAIWHPRAAQRCCSSRQFSPALAQSPYAGLDTAYSEHSSGLQLKLTGLASSGSDARRAHNTTNQ
jgi:hypothetical protein